MVQRREGDAPNPGEKAPTEAIELARMQLLAKQFLGWVEGEQRGESTLPAYTPTEIIHKLGESFNNLQAIRQGKIPPAYDSHAQHPPRPATKRR